MSKTVSSTPRWNPNAIRRRVQHLRIVPGAIHCFQMLSKTRHGIEPHFMEVDLQTGLVSCDCEDFQFRYARKWPKIENTDQHCKHIAPCLKWLRRHHYLESAPVMQRPCATCGVDEAQHGLADENGHAVPGGFICSDCVKRARMMDTPPHAQQTTNEAHDESFDSGYEEWLNEVFAAGDSQADEEYSDEVELLCPYDENHGAVAVVELENGHGPYTIYCCDHCGEIPAHVLFEEAYC